MTLTVINPFTAINATAGSGLVSSGTDTVDVVAGSGLLLTADQISVYFGIITSGQIVRWDGTKFVGSNS
jgi:hypothetical protein